MNRKISRSIEKRACLQNSTKIFMRFKVGFKFKTKYPISLETDMQK